MLFVGIALLVAAGLALGITAGAGSLVGLSQDQTGHLVPLLVVLILVAGGMFARRRAVGELLGGIVMWAGLFAIAIGGYAYRTEIMGAAARVVGELAPGQPVLDPKTGQVSFRRGIAGHFQVNAKINGASIPLIFDTGASAMVLTVSDAKKAGIDTSNLVFAIPVSTANGTGKAALVHIDKVDIGGIIRTNIRAFVTADNALDTSLLGMTFLETLQRYSVSQDLLELTD